jgi:hypothetical protein
MERDRREWDAAPAGAWAQARDKEGAGWAGLMPPDPVETAFARNVDIRFRMLQASHAVR